MGLKKRNKASAEFNLSSLTDIVFLLLIFFMLTSSLASPNVKNLKRPVSSSKTPSPQNIALSVTAEGEYFEGQMHGRWIFYQNQGVLIAQEQTYKNGILDGVSISYDKKGKKISEIHYKNGQFHGDYKIWDDKGNLRKHYVYKEGVIVKDKSPTVGGSK